MPALFVKHLTVMDFSYVDPSRGILGESWIVDVVLHGELDHQGMVFDFGHVKKQIKHAIDESYDHRLLVPKGLSKLRSSIDDGGLTISWQDNQGKAYRHLSPPSAAELMPCKEITVTSIAPLMETRLKQLLPSNVTDIAITLRPEAIDGAFYHYSHGLKKHDGNCQRIAHGHRSRIDIQFDGQHSPDAEAFWANQWQDIYIGTKEDVISTQSDDDQITFAYQAPQGYFELTLPRDRCYLISTDSTVEYLADHIAKETQKRHPGHQINVCAYEGVLKGAMAKA
ncbi:6-pyruvoyl tetrahydropterin reductase [Gammaproteobacteria bacterium 45_16_T64]|nr:6-pyruvoyl tetrahydropterin reductase [Gammaproteobacteria bacterium 45_16_T64]